MANNPQLATQNSGARTKGAVSDAAVREIISTDEARAVRVWATGAPCPSVAELRQRFRLTPTQARVVQLLVARRTNSEISSLLDVSIHTARRHVEAALLRLDVGSRWRVEQRIQEAEPEIPRLSLTR